MQHKDNILITKIINEIEFAVKRIENMSQGDFMNDIDAQHSVGMATRYISNNTKVATVNKYGVVKGLRAGTATIYIQDIGGRYCKTTVTVK